MCFDRTSCVSICMWRCDVRFWNSMQWPKLCKKVRWLCNYTRAYKKPSNTQQQLRRQHPGNGRAFSGCPIRQAVILLPGLHNDSERHQLRCQPGTNVCICAKQRQSSLAKITGACKDRARRYLDVVGCAIQQTKTAAWKMAQHD